MATEVDIILKERQKSYGTFIDQSCIVVNLKDIIRSTENWDRNLAPDMQESLDMICTKMGRILNGDPGHLDSWHDIAGYAELVAKRLEGEVL